MQKRRLVQFAIGLGVTVLAIGVAVPFRADAAWRAMNAEITALRTEVRATPLQREVLWGEASPGNARAHYTKAAAAARALQKDHHDELVSLLPHSRTDAASRLDALRAAWQPILAPLRDGAAAADDTTALPGDGGAPPRIENLLDSRWIANVAVFESRALRHEGRDVEAVQWTLDGAAMSRDLLRRGILIDQMIGCATLAITTMEAWPEPALDELDGEALDVLATGLARLDASLPIALDDRMERLFMAWQLQNSAGDETWLPSLGASWRYGFSTRWMLADAFLRQGALSHRLAERANAPWPEWLALWEQESAAALASGNPVIATCLPNLSGVAGNWREVVGALRLLRASVDLHRGKPLPKLLDPFTGQVVRVVENGREIALTCAAVGDRPAKQRIVRR